MLDIESGLTTNTVSPDCPTAITHAGPEACTAWARFTTDERYRPSTRLAYRSAALKFLRWLEAEKIALVNVTPCDVEHFLDRQDASDRSKVTYRTAIRRLYDVILDHELVTTNPADQAGRGTYDLLNAALADSGETIPSEPEPGELPPTLAEIKAAIRELDPPTMDDNPEMLDAGVVLLAGLQLGTAELMPITRFTGVSARRVTEFAKRLRANGVWTEDGTTTAQWHEEQGWMALLLDILVATGMMERCDDPKDDTRNLLRDNKILV